VLDTQLVENLYNVLKEENEVYQKFLVISKEKTEVIIKSDIIGLENIIKSEQRLIDRIKELERIREGIVLKIYLELNIEKNADFNSYAKSNISDIEHEIKHEIKPDIYPATDYNKVAKTEVNTASDVAPITISSIIDKMDVIQAAKIKRIKDDIISSIEEIRKTSMLNKNLINNAIEYIDFSMNLIMQASDKSVKYNKDGKEKTAEKRSLFDIKL